MTKISYFRTLMLFSKSLIRLGKIQSNTPYFPKLSTPLTKMIILRNLLIARALSYPIPANESKPMLLSNLKTLSLIIWTIFKPFNYSSQKKMDFWPNPMFRLYSIIYQFEIKIKYNLLFLIYSKKKTKYSWYNFYRNLI